MTGPSPRWTDKEAIRAKLRREWDSGRLLAARVPGQQESGTEFPFVIRLTRPSARDLLNNWGQAQDWAASIMAEDSFRTNVESIPHRSLGRQDLPVSVEFPDSDSALRALGKLTAAHRFDALVASTPPELLPWVARYPHQVLSLGPQWSAVVAAAQWIAAHPTSGVYIRQIDPPGVHSKIIEANRKVIAGLLDTLGVPGAPATGKGWFERRYGLATRPLLVRFRFLDSRTRIVPNLSDLTVPVGEFAELRPEIDRIVVTENEINFLALPDLPRTMAIWGSGNTAPELLAPATWLRDVPVDYWGDIDTHGFQILSRVRSVLPHVRSLLMDRETLMGHRDFWGREEKQVQTDLPHLTPAESDLYDELRDNRIGDAVRLEQERTRFSLVHRALARPVDTAR